MNRDFYGRCHPDNIWALKGLEKCLTKRLQSGMEETEKINSIDCENTRIELTEIQTKIELLNNASDIKINVACMCATKMANLK